MRHLLALAACCALAVTPVALASESQNTDVPETAVPTPPPPPCTPLRALYSPKRWRIEHPLRRANPCPSKNARELREYFYLYRHYRRIAPYRCHGGREGYYVKPCILVRCESEPDFSWGSLSYAGARAVYQLMPVWGGPWPVRSFRDRVRHHEIADSLGLSNWDASAHCWA